MEGLLKIKLTGAELRAIGEIVNYLDKEGFDKKIAQLQDLYDTLFKGLNKEDVYNKKLRFMYDVFGSVMIDDGIQEEWNSLINNKEELLSADLNEKYDFEFESPKSLVVFWYVVEYVHQGLYEEDNQHNPITFNCIETAREKVVKVIEESALSIALRDIYHEAIEEDEETSVDLLVRLTIIFQQITEELLKDMVILSLDYLNSDTVEELDINKTKQDIITGLTSTIYDTMISDIEYYESTLECTSPFDYSEAIKIILGYWSNEIKEYAEEVSMYVHMLLVGLEQCKRFKK